jgi:hypothetical protein
MAHIWKDIAMQYEMWGAGNTLTAQHSLKLAARLQALHHTCRDGRSASVREESDSQTLAAFGAAGVDDRATTTGLHANQETMGTGAADFGRLVGAFHVSILRLPVLRVTRDYHHFSQLQQDFA